MVVAIAPRDARPPSRRAPWLAGLFAIALPVLEAGGGEIPGLPGNVPLAHAPGFELGFYNDFLARGGSLDDLRTQQLALAGRVDGRYHLALDLSVLTAKQIAEPGRVDQLSATFGVAVLNRYGAETAQRVVVGTGLRAHGDFGGERIQNGFHQLVGSGLDFLPYRNGEKDAALAFADAQHQATLRAGGAWTSGYWLRASLLGTMRGQLDASAAAYLTLDHRSVKLWAGLRQDWRSGYDAAVTAAVADAESDTAAVLGLRWGALVLETVQQFDNDASYGQLRLVSNGFDGRAVSDATARFSIDTGFLLPDVQATVRGRYRPTRLNPPASRWTMAIVAGLRYGKPQFDDNTLYLETIELDAGVDWERRVVRGQPGAAWFATLGAGLREERIVGGGARDGQRSGRVSSAVGRAGAGVRVRLADSGGSWRLGLELGATFSAPLDDGSVSIGDESYRVLSNSLAAGISVLFERR